MNSKIKVLAIVPSLYDTSPGQRFRIEQWEPILRGNGVEITYAPFESKELRQVLYQTGHTFQKIKNILRNTNKRRTEINAVKDFDLIYVFREAAIFGPAWFEKKIAGSGVPMIFDFDYAVFVPYKSPSNGYISYLKFPSKIRSICRLSAHVMAGNRFLADYANEVNENVTIIPTTIDTDKYIPNSGSAEAKVPTILWSGSFSTVQHLDTVRSALQKLAKEEKFKLRVIGTPQYKLEGVETEAIQWRAETEIEDLQAGNIGIMPLPDESWSKGKCGLKALQYMALGIPTICSPVGVNSEIIQDGENGFLASTEDEWIDKLKLLIHSPEKCLQLGKAGRATVEEKYSAIRQAPRVYQVFASVISQNLLRQPF